MAKEDVKFPEGNDPYKKEVCKDGMEFYVSKSPMTVGYDNETKPVPIKDKPVVLP